MGSVVGVVLLVELVEVARLYILPVLGSSKQGAAFLCFWGVDGVWSSLDLDIEHLQLFIFTFL